MSEKIIQSQILLAIGSQPGTRIFRNSVGIGKLQDGSMIRFGLCPGSADLIGWHTVTVTPDMVGQNVAVFLSIEVKAPKGRVRPEQDNWLKVVKAAGGLAVIARSPSDALSILDLP